MTRTNTYFQLRISPEDKEFLKEKAEQFGYSNVSAFVMESVRNHFRIELDMKPYRTIATEINYIGKNINSLVRRINTDGFYADTDLEKIELNQRKIIELMNKEYDKLLRWKKNLVSSKMSLEDKQAVIKSYQENQLPIPKRLLLEDLFEKIKEDLLYVCELIAKSPSKHEGLDEYVFDYMQGRTFSELSEAQLNAFSNELFDYVQRLKFKMVNLDNQFDDDDWYEFKDILDAYEVY